MDVAQCKMARAALGWELSHLSSACGVDERSIARFESGGPALPGQIRAIRAALEAKGVEFFEDGAAVGAVRLVQPAMS